MASKRTQSDSENDYEVVGVSQGNKPGGIVSVRLKPEEMELLVALSEVSGRTLSETMPFIGPMQQQDNRATAFVCRDFACREPVTTPDALAAQLQPA